jgi:dTDP-4-dehydrorhamnose reductase
LSRMMRVGVLGPTGMVGGAVTAVLRVPDIEVITIGRRGCDIYFDADLPDFTFLDTQKLDFLVNCIGVIPQKMQDENPFALSRMLKVNSVFPHLLTERSLQRGIKVIQIATDCVFSGSSGPYFETSEKDATDNYGVSKALGELESSNLMTIRCSIVGSEENGTSSLLDWVKSQPPNALINGYVDRLWNGISSLAFAKVIRGFILNGEFQSGHHHLVPADSLSKADLVTMLSREFSRPDIKVKTMESGKFKDLRLGTIAPHYNQELWGLGGYRSIPEIKQLMRELSDWETNLKE